MKGMPKNKQYVVHHGDKFGTVSLGIVYGLDMVFADVWERNHTFVAGVHQVHGMTYDLQHWLDAVINVDHHVHPNADGMGKWRPYKTPYQLAQEFWPQDFKEETA